VLSSSLWTENIAKMDIKKKIIDVIVKNNTFLVTSHMNPDGDAVGSMGGMFYLLKTLGKDVHLYNTSEIPDRFSYLDIKDYVVHKLLRNEYDCIIFLDCGDKYRAGKEIDRLQVKVSINIDHHPTNDNFADINWVDATMSSVGEMIFYLIKEARVELTYDISECLYTAIVSDTGSFTFSNTRPSTLKVVMEILENGFDLDDFNRKYQRYWTLNKVHLHGLAMQNAKLYFDGKLALTKISRELFEKTNTTSEEAEGIINYLRQIKGVKVAAILREDEDKVKVSMRSWGEVDVSKIAMELNGGGHKNAAGGSLDLPLDEAEEAFIKCVAGFIC